MPVLHTGYSWLYRCGQLHLYIQLCPVCHIASYTPYSYNVGPARLLRHGVVAGVVAGIVAGIVAGVAAGVVVLQRVL
jgi:hypothetical protein